MYFELVVSSVMQWPKTPKYLGTGPVQYLPARARCNVRRVLKDWLKARVSTGNTPAVGYPYDSRELPAGDLRSLGCRGINGDGPWKEEPLPWLPMAEEGFSRLEIFHVGSPFGGSPRKGYPHATISLNALVMLWLFSSPGHIVFRFGWGWLTCRVPIFGALICS